MNGTQPIGRSGRRKTRAIVSAAALIYAAILGFTWVFARQLAERNVRAVLENAEQSFTAIIQGELEAVLRYTCGGLINLFDGKCKPMSTKKLQDIAAKLNIDEINLIDNDGIVIGSNVPELKGVDFKRSPLTQAFLSLTNEMVSAVTQPFRHGVDNPDSFCKYYGMAFPDRQGILQIGLSNLRLRQNMYNATEEESAKALREWNFSIVGWYQRESRTAAYEPGRIILRRDELTGIMTRCRFFDFFGYHYSAVLPADFRNDEVLATLVITALASGLLIAFFSFAIIRLNSASDKLETLHAEADARTAADLLLARRIQMAALPSARDAFIGMFEISLAADSRPAREVGGDFYDFYPLPDRRIAFLVADVSGKGIPAAMFMMKAKNVLKNCLTGFSDLSDAVRTANERLCDANEAEMFVTAWVGIVSLSDGRVEFVNAGHNRPFIRHADGSIEKVMGKGGLFLGMFPDATYRRHEIRLRQGDRLFLYTDGITEAMNSEGRIFGESRLQKALADDDVPAALQAFVGKAEQSDDVTHLALDWLGAPAESSRDFTCGENALDEVIAFIRDQLGDANRATVARILNAADEIASNIVNYSGAESFSVVVTSCADRIRLTFSDTGREYNPLTHADPDTRASIENRPIGGLGLVMVKKLVDSITYTRENGRNVLKLIKRLPQRS